MENFEAHIAKAVKENFGYEQSKEETVDALDRLSSFADALLSWEIPADISQAKEETHG